MTFATYPVIEGHDPVAFLDSAEWKWLTDLLNNKSVNAVTQELGVVPLGDFFNYSREDAVENLCADEVEDLEAEAEPINGTYYLDGIVLWPLERQWFEPVVALKTTGGLLDVLCAQPERFSDPKCAAEGFSYVLEELEKVLVQARDQRRRFYLTSVV